MNFRQIELDWDSFCAKYTQRVRKTYDNNERLSFVETDFNYGHVISFPTKTIFYPQKIDEPIHMNYNGKDSGFRSIDVAKKLIEETFKYYELKAKIEGARK